ncbi:MAG TPA: response regulator, partial [Coleofasciculaceae cyanobacterium]
ETFSNYLIGFGYRLLLANNLQDVIALVTTHQPNILVIDTQILDMSSTQSIPQLRSLPELVNVPILALGESGDSGDRENYLEARANAYLTKPVSLRHLATSIRQLLAEAAKKTS